MNNKCLSDGGRLNDLPIGGQGGWKKLPIGDQVTIARSKGCLR